MPCQLQDAVRCKEAEFCRQGVQCCWGLLRRLLWGDGDWIRKLLKRRGGHWWIHCSFWASQEGQFRRGPSKGKERQVQNIPQKHCNIVLQAEVQSSLLRGVTCAMQGWLLVTSPNPLPSMIRFLILLSKLCPVSLSRHTHDWVKHLQQT